MFTDLEIPLWSAIAVGAATLAMFAGIAVIIIRGKRAAQAGDNPTANDVKSLRRLFIAALIPSLAVIVAVMAISFVGLASFARDDMGWHSWIRFIVPVSLDGISITFGFWAFVAVKRGRDPRRSERIVYAGALISAFINFNHGRQEWTGAAGVYLGFLSLASAWLFHELLAQFTDAQHELPKTHRHGVPAFGERWLWAFWSTLMARRAWVVHPPGDGVPSTAANALAHLAQVQVHRALQRDTKGVRHQAAVQALTRQLHEPKPAATPANPPAGQPPNPVPATGNRQTALIGPVTR